MTIGTRRRRLLELGLLAGAVLLVALAAVAVVPPCGLMSDDEGVKHIQMESFRRGGWRSIEIPYPSRSLDERLRFLGEPRKLVVQDGRLLCTYPPLFSFLSSLFAPLLGCRAVHVLPLGSFLLSILVARQILSRLVRRRALARGLLIIYGLATPAPLYALTFWEHSPALLLAMLGFHHAVLYFQEGRRPIHVFAATAWLASGVFFRTEMAVLAVAFAVCLLGTCMARKRDVAAVLAGLGVPAATYCAVSARLYGSMLGLHVRYNRPLQPFSRLQLFVALALLLDCVLVWFRLRRSDDWPSLSRWLPLVWLGLLLTYFADSVVPRLVLECPMVLAVFLCVRSQSEEDATVERLVPVALGTFVIFLTTMALLFEHNPHRDVRYVMPALVPAIVVVGLYAERLAEGKATRVVLALLVLLSLVSTGRRLVGEFAFYQRLNQRRVEQLRASTSEGDVVVFSDNPLFEHAGPLYFSRRLMVARDRSEIAELAALLARRGIARWHFQTEAGEAVALEKALVRASGQYRIERAKRWDFFVLYTLVDSPLSNP